MVITLTVVLDGFLTPILKVSISHLYYQIKLMQTESSRPFGRRIWGEKYQRSFAQDFGALHSSSVCVRHGLIPFKVVHRVYGTKTWVSKTRHADVNPACDRCEQSHMVLARSIYNFCMGIFSNLSEMMGEEIEPNPISALFGFFSSIPSLSHA